MKYGEIDGRPTERTTTSETFAVPGTKGGISVKLNKIQDVEYVVPKESEARGDYKVKDAYNAPIDKREFDRKFDLIDWSK